MAEDSDGVFKLTVTEKIQLGAFAAGTGIFLLTYLIAAALNGFTYVNQWILDNKIPVFFYWSIQIGLSHLQLGLRRGNQTSPENRRNKNSEMVQTSPLDRITIHNNFNILRV